MVYFFLLLKCCLGLVGLDPVLIMEVVSVMLIFSYIKFLLVACLFAENVASYTETIYRSKLYLAYCCFHFPDKFFEFDEKNGLGRCLSRNWWTLTSATRKKFPLKVTLP